MKEKLIDIVQEDFSNFQDEEKLFQSKQTQNIFSLNCPKLFLAKTKTQHEHGVAS